ncbi:MAG TPA: hypothetical protein VF748_15990 [Candidatus Acidoferrum sp.]
MARYLKPIGKGVEGPSIRFAEAAIRLMGNIAVEQATIYDDREKRIVRVTVTDCESNTPYSAEVAVEKTVERRTAKDGDEVIRTRTNKRGDLLYIISATEDDLLNKQNALISKAIRTNGMRLIPGDIVEECMAEVLATQRNEDAIDPEAGKRKIFDAFASVGVNAEQLKSYLGHQAEKLSEKEIMDLRAIFSGIKDGESTWREITDAKENEKAPKEEASPLKQVKEQLKKKDQSEIWPKKEQA